MHWIDNYDSQDRASIAASRGKNVTFFMVHCVCSIRLYGLLQSCVYKQQCCFDFVAGMDTALETYYHRRRIAE